MVEETKPDKVEQDNEPTEVQDGGGESGSYAGAAPTSDYAMLMNTLREVQENQADLKAQLKKISDAQSVLVDSGAVVREIPAYDIKESNTISTDGFISLDEMDLSI